MAEMVGVWTEEQNDAIVADYFAMLADDSRVMASARRRMKPSNWSR